MRLGALNASWRLASVSNRILLASNLILSLALLVVGGAAINNRDRLLIVPPNIDRPYTLGWRSATPEYHKSMALYFSGLIGQIGPRNVEFTLTLIERFFDAPVADGIKKKLRAVAADYQFQQSTSTAWFEAERVAWEERTGKVYVIGQLMTSSSMNRSVAQKSVTYEYRIEIREGQPSIVHFDSYDGNVAHTEEWLRDPRKAEQEAKRRAGEESATRRNIEVIETRQANEAGAKGQP